MLLTENWFSETRHTTTQQNKFLNILMFEKHQSEMIWCFFLFQTINIETFFKSIINEISNIILKFTVT